MFFLLQLLLQPLLHLDTCKEFQYRKSSFLKKSFARFFRHIMEKAPAFHSLRFTFFKGRI